MTPKYFVPLRRNKNEIFILFEPSDKSNIMYALRRCSEM